MLGIPYTITYNLNPALNVAVNKVEEEICENR